MEALGYLAKTPGGGIDGEGRSRSGDYPVLQAQNIRDNAVKLGMVVDWWASRIDRGCNCRIPGVRIIAKNMITNGNMETIVANKVHT